MRYQMNDIGMVSERHNALIGEAGEGRPKGEGSYPGKTWRRAALLLSAIGIAVLLAASAAYALNVRCEPSNGSDPCLGTDADDDMNGTDGTDNVVGLGGDDTIRGLAAPDRLTGDGNAAEVPGDDDLFGGSGADTLVGGEDSDLLSGEKGDDHISADFLVGDGTDTVKGGPGSDTVNAEDAQKDIVDCGPGRDRVVFDVGLDSVKRCEIKEAF